MAQVTIYLPDDVEKLVRRRAREARKSLSAYIAELATARTTRTDRRAQLEALCGSWEGDAPVDEPLPPLDEPQL
jgi:hypothetical protein